MIDGSFFGSYLAWRADFLFDAVAPNGPFRWVLFGSIEALRRNIRGGAYLVRPACPRRGISFSFMSPFAESLLAIRAPLRLMVVYEKGSPVIFPLKSIPYIELVACI